MAINGNQWAINGQSMGQSMAINGGEAGGIDVGMFNKFHPTRLAPTDNDKRVYYGAQRAGRLLITRIILLPPASPATQCPMSDPMGNQWAINAGKGLKCRWNSDID